MKWSTSRYSMRIADFLSLFTGLWMCNFRSKFGAWWRREESSRKKEEIEIRSNERMAKGGLLPFSPSTVMDYVINQKAFHIQLSFRTKESIALCYSSFFFHNLTKCEQLPSLRIWLNSNDYWHSIHLLVDTAWACLILSLRVKEENRSQSLRWCSCWRNM